MGNCRRDCNLGRLIEPVDVVGKNKVGNNIGNNQYSPIWKKNYVPGNKTGKNFQKSLDYPIVFDNKRSYFWHSTLGGGREFLILVYCFLDLRVFFRMWLVETALYLEQYS